MRDFKRILIILLVISVSLTGCKDKEEVKKVEDIKEVGSKVEEKLPENKELQEDGNLKIDNLVKDIDSNIPDKLKNYENYETKLSVGEYEDGKINWKIFVELGAEYDNFELAKEYYDGIYNTFKNGKYSMDLKEIQTYKEPEVLKLFLMVEVRDEETDKLMYSFSNTIDNEGSKGEYYSMKNYVDDIQETSKVDWDDIESTELETNDEKLRDKNTDELITGSLESNLYGLISEIDEVLPKEYKEYGEYTIDYNIKELEGDRAGEKDWLIHMRVVVDKDDTETAHKVFKEIYEVVRSSEHYALNENFKNDYKTYKVVGTRLSFTILSKDGREWYEIKANSFDVFDDGEEGFEINNRELHTHDFVRWSEF